MFLAFSRLTGRAEGNMKMLRRMTRRDDRVDPAIGKFTEAEMTEEGLSWDNVERQCEKCHGRHEEMTLELDSGIHLVARDIVEACRLVVLWLSACDKDCRCCIVW